MSFYGNISNAGKTSLIFDRVYPNRKAMDNNCQEDEVFVGRCVLIEYDDNTFAYNQGFVVYGVNGINKNDLYQVYGDITATKPYRIGDIPDSEGYGIAVGSVVRAKVINDDGSFASRDTFFFVCEGIMPETNNIAAFKLVDQATLPSEALKPEDGESITDYDLNYYIDKKYSEDNQIPFNSGWDSTVWQKVAEHGILRYKMIASLNSESPIFKVRSEAPSITPVAPHFGEESTNMTYTLHMPTTWGFKVKNIEDADEDEELFSDEKVIYKFSVPDKGKEENKKDDDEDEEETLPSLKPDLEGKPYSGAIYYNKKGFDKRVRNVSNAKNTISVLPTGYSKDYPDYYVHDDKAIKGLAPDMQELTIQLPAIGNAVAELWDLMYGERNDENEYLTIRNDNIEWNDTSGIRMIHNDPEAGGFKLSPNKTESVAGAINSLHDLMGMIITTAPEGEETKEEALERALPNRIYFGPLGETGHKGFFFKDTQFEFIPFADIPNLNAQYEAQGKPVPFPNYDPENFVGSKTYFDLTQFLPNKYYTYADNNFYLDANDVPTADTSYYLLGEPKVVALKEWHGEVENEETGRVEEEVVYYNLNGDYIKDTSDITDSEKDYFTIVEKRETYPEEDPDREGPVILIYNPTAPGTYEGGSWEDIIDSSAIDNNNIVEMNTNGFFYLAMSEDPESPGNFTIPETLIEVKPTDPFDPQKIYYKIPLYATGISLDADGQPTRFNYLINKDKTIANFEDVVKGQNGGENFAYDKYKIRLIDFIPEHYYSKEEFTITLENGTEKIEQGFKCLDEREFLDKTVTYYSLTVTPVTGEGNLITPPEGEEGGEVPPVEEDILFTHYYRPDEYYFKNNTNDYILSTTSTFNPEQTYYKLTDINGELLEKNPTTNLFIINPVSDKFYEPNKYYYVSISLGGNKLDSSVEMKAPNHSDVNPQSIHEVKDDDGNVIDRQVYFIPQEAYVVSDSADILKKGMVWDKIPEPPATVTLGGRYEKLKWTELKGFGRTLNTVNGLILQLNKYFKFDDKYTRDESTIQGCLNKLNDILNLTDNLNPNNLMVVDGYGRMIGASLADNDSSSWISAEVKTNGTLPTLSIEHTYPEVADNDLEEIGGLKIDKNGHVRSVGTTGPTVDSLNSTIVELQTAVNKLNGNSSTAGSVAYQIAQIVNDNNNGSIDTLNEIAAWIISDTTGAAAMNKDITDLKGLVGNTAVATQINNAIDSALKSGDVDKYALASELKALADKITDEKIAKWDAAETNVQSDWDENDANSDAYIKNKPSLDFVSIATYEALVERINQLEARIQTLENTGSEPTPEEPPATE